jgi:dynein heavy chain
MNSLHDGRIPSHWLRISWSAETMKNWFDQRRICYDQYAKWIETGHIESFWLGDIFNPAGFLNSLRQETCRIEKWALDQTYLETEVQVPSNNISADKDKDSQKGAIYIRGLFLEGARWEKKSWSK